MLFFKRYSKKQVCIGALLIALAAMGFYLAWQYFQKEIGEREVANKEIVASKEFEDDKFGPSSQIKSPSKNSWQGKDFNINVLDEDLESGLDINSCRYRVISYLGKKEIYSTGWLPRICNSVQKITVGEEQQCRTQGREACEIQVKSKDNAGHWCFPNEEEGSIRYYYVDWTKPIVGKILAPKIKVNLGESQIYQTFVSDNQEITNCWFYLNGEVVLDADVEIRQVSSNNGKEYEIQTFFAFDNEGKHFVFFGCKDRAENYDFGETTIIEVTTNHSPEISFCRVEPVQGNVGDEFQFIVEASDSDNDELSYFWDFGDGKSSNEKSPFHQYNKTGTYKPKVIVSDGEKEAECPTAWVSVNE